ncbi:hypothetical protein C7974DRAFT_402282 [Boeremia exigua]|uniref:uncharacterized protein n=1 Tax=Boeremia exigua TaxID=749465 RepID=UPI001E8E110C|nr:uncharacterized protein C7974DRAFT_402282 [Boeremia exigua]KAH6616699.1 hypothetical protein C7974DRAFT_402282 [Boeremia exigua]
MNLSTLRPVFRPFSAAASLFRTPATQCAATRTPATTSPFSSTARLEKRQKGPGIDPRITNIRYHLSHPLTPRPLHFSRNRFLRHWTIHRAWMLFLRKRRWAEERELERQYMSMRAACEHLRLMDSNGNQVGEEEAGGQGPDAGRLGVRGRDVGRLYRSAMIKRGIWGSVPVEYARVQTEYPSRQGWNHEWTRN